MKTQSVVSGSEPAAAGVHRFKLVADSQTTDNSFTPLTPVRPDSRPGGGFTKTKRSTVMNYRNSLTRFLQKGLLAFVALVLVAGLAFGQDLIVGANASFSGSGTFNVKGKIDNSAKSSATTIGGTVNLSGGLQDIGATGGGALTFSTLNPQGTDDKTMIVDVTVSSALTVNIAVDKFLDVKAKTLNIGGTSTLTAGSLKVSDAGSRVNYTRDDGTAQVALGLTYAGTLGMSGSSAKSLSAATSAATLSHTGGGLTADQDLTVTGTAASAIGTLTNVSANKKLLKNNTGTLTIATVSGNAGTIDLTAAGIVNFTGAVTSGGTIQASAGTLDFDGNVNNTGGTIKLTSSASANFGGTFADATEAGTLTLSSTSTVTYDGGSAQNIGPATYGTLNMSGAGVKTALGNLTIATAFDNGTATTDIGTFTLGGNGAKTQASGGTMRFGGTNNGLLITAGTVDYNASSGTQIVAGHATDKYATLLFTVGGTKEISANVRVATSGNLTIAASVTAEVKATGQMLVDGNLTVNGSLTNAGTVTVGQ